ncbi:hypothetical protein IGL59_000306 [Enterococcus sp. AZ116]|uniref:isopeptide-forming domain-containing fimbrial protein n=1 Tax=unclassified Enterococcus TaxID=2608891 RepID=UPI003D3013D5
MVVGQNIAGVTAFAETISNQESIVEDIYFEKDNTKISEITLEQGKEETITFVDENKEDEEAIVTLPESTKLNLTETNLQLGDASIVNYNEDTNQVKIAFKNKEQNIKRTNLILVTSDTVENNQARMYAQVIRQDSQTYMSKPVIITTTTSSENNKQQEETQKNEEDGESAQQSSTNSESSNSLDINSLNKEQKNEVENNSNVDSTESTSVKKELQDKEESKIKRVIESRSNIDANIPTPPASSTNILDYFNVPNLGNASNAASVNDDYPQSVTINPNSTGQFGVMWANTVIDLTNDFDMSAYVYMYNPINPEKHGDGLNFVLQNDSNENKAYGQTGWGIGTYGTSSEAKIKNALAFEMDTYYNGSGSELGIDVIGDGQTQNLQKVNYNGHIAVLETNKDVSSDYASASGIDTGHGGNFGQMTHNNVQYGTDTNPVFGNKWKNFKVHWDSANQIITYELEGFNPTNYHVSDLNQTFGGKLVRFGFTGSTGSSTEYNLVSFNQLPVAPVTVFYKDIDTNEEIADSELLTGKLGDSWKSEQKDIDQYEFVKVDKKTEGSFTQTAQEVTYFYRKLLPKVEVKKSVDKETAKVGDELTYTITAKNSGEGNWNGTITDKIPMEYVNLVSGTTTVNGEKVEDNDVWKDNVLNVKQTIKAGESVTITFKVKIIKAAEGQTIANVAETDDPNVPPTPPAETKVPKVELTKTADKANAKVGEEITYTITAKNSGNGDWENGTITDKIPTEYVNLVSGTTTVNGGKVEDNNVWKDNVLNVKQTIKAGESVTITFKVKTIKAAEGQTIANVAETDDPNVPPTPPAETKVPKVELTKTADKANAKVGEEITYTITAKNSGNGDWENGTITDKIPTEYVNLVSGTTTVNGEKVEDNNVWKDNVLNVKQTIKAGESVTITFKVKTIKAAEGQTIANVAETDDPNVPPTPPAETKVPKVELTKTADKANAKVGEEITYTITAKNSGNGDWENGTITDKIPTEYVNLVSGTTTVNGEKVEDNNVWKDNVLNVKQTIKAGESVTITFKVKTIKAAEGQTIANVAETDDPNVPPTPPAETKVPKVELTKTADKANAKVGEEITYTITAKNSGNGDWENGTITDKIPTEYVNLISGTTTVNGEKVEDNNVWKDNVLNVKQTIKAGESVTITFKVKTIKAAEGQTIANVAETDDPNVPPTPPAETKVPKVELTKTADKANAKVGEEITYTITAKNSGNGDWENGTITDKIPTEYVNLVSGTTTVNGEKVEDNNVWKDNVLNVKQTIKAGESVTITFKVKTIKAAEGQTIANVAETDDPNVPPTPPAETKVPKVELTKTADKANAKVGEEITYTITAKNSGNGDWENGTITDKIPTEYVNLVSGTTTVNGEKVEDNDVWKDNVLNVKQTIKAGESVTITFKVKTIKAAEGQTIANVAETDDPNVPPTPPAETKVPIEPTIHKNIEGVQKLVLKNNKQKFNWNITVSFGTNTMNWKQASITDSVNNLLDIVEVTVVDENGKDVTGNGTLSTENNEVVFEINKKDDSYTYLAGHTYTMTITTKIKGSVTDEELAPYIKDGGIPNQADLNFGNEGDKKHSEIPTIVPSKGTPPEKTNTPSNQNDKGNLTPSKGIFPHTGENQMLSNILLVVGTGILIILTVYYILKKRRIE